MSPTDRTLTLRPNILTPQPTTTNHNHYNQPQLTTTTTGATTTTTVARYIQSGGFGRGWEGKDTVTGDKLFIKTFRSFSDRAPRSRTLTPEQVDKLKSSQEGAVRKEIEVLLHPYFRVMTSIPEVCSNDLCYGSVYVPYTQRKSEMFFICTKDLCDGGELFNYICPTSPPYVRPLTEGTCRR
jgi:hypothetical protein